MNNFDKLVRAKVFEVLVAGISDPTTQVLAESTGFTVDAVAESLKRLAAQHRLVLSAEGDRVVMAHPFSSVPTNYEAHVGNRSWWANCAWDAFAILALLGDGDAVATPTDRNHMTWTVSAGIVEPEGIVHFVVPPMHFWDNIEFT